MERSVAVQQVVTVTPALEEAAAAAKVRSSAPELRFVALDSWRGLCAIGVTIYHFPVAGPWTDSVFISHSFLLVDFFFLLSGFVIGTVYEGKMGTWHQRAGFAIRRVGRIWPMHLVMLGAFVLAVAVKGEIGDEPRHSVASIFTNMALIQALGVHRELTWNEPAWSVSVEVFLYAMFMVLSAVRWRLAVYVAVILGSLLLIATLAPYGMKSTYDFGVFRGLADFFTGALVARIPRRSLGTLMEGVMIAVMIIFVYLAKAPLLAPLVFGSAVYVFASGSGLFSRVLEIRPLALLGEWSYSIYLVHAAAVAVVWAIASHVGLTQVGKALYAPYPWDILAPLPYLAAVVAISAVTYNVIEKPARDFFNRRAPRRKVVAPAG